MNKKIILVLVILVSICTISHAFAADATDDVACATSDEDTLVVNDVDVSEVDSAIVDEDYQLMEDSAPEPNLGTNYSGSIQEMINLAQEGDTINLNGTYYLDYPININKTIHINGTDGGAIFKINESIKFQTSILYVNYTASNVTLNNIRFIGSSFPWGGAIFWQGDNGAITNCEFKDNEVNGDLGLAGAVFVEANNFTMINSTFIHNIAYKSGGAVLLNGTGARIINCTFKENRANNEKGGAIVVMGSYCNIAYCSFEKNQAGKFGGAIYWMGDNGTLANCEFKENNANGNDSYAGALLLSANNCLVTNCNFTDNYCYECGGAIYITDEKNNNITYCRFNDNRVLNPISAGTGGGAIYSSCDGCVIDNCNFKQNNALESCGGAVVLANGKNTIENSFFEGNSAEWGNDIFDNALSNVTSNHFLIDFDETISQAIYGIAEEKLRNSGNTFEKIKRNSTVTFETGLIFEYGRSGSITVMVEGGTLELKNICVLNHPEAKITFSKNVLTVSNLPVGSFKLRVTTTPYENYNAVSSDLSITVKKATAVIKASKVTVAYKKSTKWSITIINSRTQAPISNLKVTLKVYTGKKYKTLTVKTNSKGVASYQTKSLGVGTHKIVVSAKDSRYNFNTLTSSVKVIKQKAIKLSVKKKTHKDGASLSITVKDKKTKKPVNGVQLKVLVYTGKNYKTITLKSKKIGKFKGVCGYATNKFSVGTHKVKIMPANIKYSGSATSSMKITKRAKKAPVWETKQ